MRPTLPGLLALLALGLPAHAEAATLTAFPVPSASADLESIAAAPDGTLWFTERHTGQLGHVTLDGHISEIKVPNGTSLDDDDDIGPTRIVADPSGTSMDFITDIGGTLGFVGLDGTLQHLYSNASANAQNVAPAKGGGVWERFFEGDASVRLAHADGSFQDFGSDSESGYNPMATAPDGTMFFGDDGDALRSFTPSGTPASYPLPAGDQSETITGIAFDTAGTLHFTEYYGADDFSVPDSGGSLGTLGADGVVRTTPLGGSPLPRSMVLGPDGALWWAEKNAIGRLAPDGTVQHADIGGYDATAIAFGGDGNLWFVDDNANAVGRITLDGALFPAPTVTAPGAPTPAPGTPAPGTPAPGTPTSPALTTAPKATLLLPHLTLAAAVRRRALKPTVALSGAGTVALTASVSKRVAERLHLKTTTLGRGSHAFTGAGQATVTLKLSRKAGAALARSRKAVTVTVLARSTAPGAASATTTRSLKLKR